MPVLSPKVRLAGLLLLLLLAFLLDISVGSVKIPLGDVFHILFSSSVVIRRTIPGNLS